MSKPPRDEIFGDLKRESAEGLVGSGADRFRQKAVTASRGC